MMQDESTFHFFYSCVLFLMKPGIMWVMPTMFRSLVLGCNQYKVFFYYKAPALYPRVKPMLKKVEQRKVHFQKFANSLEVYIAIFLIPGALIFKANSYAQVMIYWQFLRMKYMTIPSC